MDLQIMLTFCIAKIPFILSIWFTSYIFAVCVFWALVKQCLEWWKVFAVFYYAQDTINLLTCEPFDSHLFLCHLCRLKKKKEILRGVFRNSITCKTFYIIRNEYWFRALCVCLVHFSPGKGDRLVFSFNISIFNITLSSLFL